MSQHSPKRDLCTKVRRRSKNFKKSDRGAGPSINCHVSSRRGMDEVKNRHENNDNNNNSHLSTMQETKQVFFGSEFMQYAHACSTLHNCLSF